jgi:hypothetical protein
VEPGLEAATVISYDRLTGIVIGYVLSVVTSVAITLVVLKTGW